MSTTEDTIDVMLATFDHGVLFATWTLQRSHNFYFLKKFKFLVATKETRVCQPPRTQSMSCWLLLTMVYFLQLGLFRDPTTSTFLKSSSFWLQLKKHEYVNHRGHNRCHVGYF